MRKILLVLILAVLGWKAYEKYGHDPGQIEIVREHAFDVDADTLDAPGIDLTASGQSVYTCDGRTYCSQMTSCDEAKYFLEHCPDVKMDGNNDGTPCEAQWCT